MPARPGSGKPGTIVKCLETGQTWPSVTALIKDPDIHAPRATLTRHWSKGDEAHINGLTFVKIGVSRSNKARDSEQQSANARRNTARHLWAGKPTSDKKLSERFVLVTDRVTGFREFKMSLETAQQLKKQNPNMTWKEVA